MKNNNFRIGIIGGGASATLILAHLAKSGCSGLSIDIYDRNAAFARGLAYATPRLCHFLNVRATNMSGYTDDANHFVRWIAAYGFKETDFAPRKLYGDYLDTLLQEAKNTLNIHQYAQDVTSCTRHGTEYLLNDKKYDFTILASGNVRALHPPINAANTGYIENPWRIDNSLKHAKSIALIGSGLTAVDAVLSLQDIGFNGAITLFSRHAHLPATHSSAQNWTLTDIHIGDSPAKILQHIRHNIRRAAASGISWHGVIDSLRPLTNDIWQNWSNAQRSAFQRHLYTLWGIHRHRMAKHVAQSVHKANITFVPSRVKCITSEGLTTTDQQSFSFDYIINCMGYRYDEAGRCFDVSEKIGPAKFGELFETTAIPEIRAQANNIALKILESAKR